MNVFAERVYDATDGFARIGNVLITDTNLDYAVQFPQGQACSATVQSNLADVLVTTSVPFSSQTFKGGITDPCVGFYVGRIGQLVVPWGTATDNDLHFGYVSTHEMAHYALFAPDLYASAPNGGGGECKNLDWDGSLMHNTGGWEGKWILTELDRNPTLTPCQHGTNNYTWDEMRGDLNHDGEPDNGLAPRYTEIPMRPNGPIEHIFDTKPRGHDDGGALDIRILDRSEATASSTFERFTPFDGEVNCDATAALVGTDRQGDASGYIIEGSPYLPSEPNLDVTTISLTWDGAEEAVTFHVGFDDLTDLPPAGATGKNIRFDFYYEGRKFEIGAYSDDVLGARSYDVSYFSSDPTEIFPVSLEIEGVTGEFDAEADELRVTVPVDGFSEAAAAIFPGLAPLEEESLLEAFSITSQRWVGPPSGAAVTPTADTASGTCPYVVGQDVDRQGGPIARNDSATTDENVPITVNVLANDHDTTGDALHISGIEQPAHGTATVNPDGTITYAPANNYNGPDEFIYTASDPGGLTDTAKVRITVVPFACPPNESGVFADDVESGDDGWSYEDASFSFAGVRASGVTWGPTDDPFASSGSTSFFSDAHGILKDDRLISPPLDLGDASELSFMHRYSFEAPEAETGTFFDGGVLEATIDGSSWHDVLELGATFVSGGYNGVMYQDEEGTRELGGRQAWGGLGSPDTMSPVTVDIGALAGNDVRFRWRLVTDDNAGNTGWFVDDVAASALVEVPETCNHPPRAQPDFASTPEDTTLEVDVLANDTDPDGDELVVTSFDATTTEDGSVSDEGDGILRYVPADGFVGTDTFTYAIEDPSGASATGDVSVTVEPNAAPDAANDSATSVDGDPVTIDLLANDSDPDGDDISVQSIDTTSDEGGSVANNGDGTATYTPLADFEGADSFAYSIVDEHGKSDGAVVSLTVVNPPNVPPVAVDDEATVGDGESVTIPVLDNDTDAESDPLALQSVDAASDRGGVVTNNGDGTVSYAAPDDISGDDGFDYVVADDQGGTDEGRVEIAITRVGTSCALNAHGDFKLRRDLDDCTGDGIVVDDELTTISLNGHTISGVGAPGSAGIRNTRYSSVTIRGPGVIEGFDTGILFAQAKGAKISNVTVRLNDDEGIVIGGSRAKITGNTVIDNGESGIVITKGKEPVVSSNQVHRNGEDGIHVAIDANKTKVKITDNAANDNQFYGIFALPGPYLRASGNTATGNHGGAEQCSPTTACT
jgi:parallel beta-helix repeat protein